MFIPSYQIHNILKDFSLQLKKKRQGMPTPPHTTAVAGRLRLTTVVTKVAENIMHRIADLGREAEAMPPVAETPPKGTNGGTSSNPAAFEYHAMDRHGAKVKKRLVVRDSRNLVERFQRLTSPDETAGDNQT